MNQLTFEQAADLVAQLHILGVVLCVVREGQLTPLPPRDVLHDLMMGGYLKWPHELGCRVRH